MSTKCFIAVCTSVADDEDMDELLSHSINRYVILLDNKQYVHACI